MEATREGSGVGLLLAFMTLFAAAAVGLAAVIPLEKVANHEHADERHVEAPVIRQRHQRGLCHETEAYVSVRRGTLLVLCKLEDKPKRTALWGGILWRVLESRHGKTTLLGLDDLYECTAYAQDWPSWEHVIARDAYAKAHDTKWYQPLQWLIDP